MEPESLNRLLERLKGLFPPEAPLRMLPSSGPEAWAAVAERYPGGHAARWFAASDGQADELPTFDAHRFCSLADALNIAETCAELRAQPDGYWVEASWIPIATDLTGHTLMLDDRDGRVLSVAHDDDHVAVLADSPEAWISGLLEAHAAGTIVWDSTFGLVEQATLDDVQAFKAAQAARRGPEVKASHIALLVLALSALITGLIWFFESRR